MADRLRGTYVAASALTISPELYEKYSTLDGLNAELDRIREIQSSIYRYRSDPVGEARRLAKERRRARRKEKRRQLRERDKRILRRVFRRTDPDRSRPPPAGS